MSQLDGGNYTIKILNDYIDYNLHKDEVYEVPLNLLKKCDTETFDNIIKLNILDNKSYKNAINNEIHENLSDISSCNEEDNLIASNISKEIIKKEEDIHERINIF